MCPSGGKKPLEGILVVDFTRVLSGPFCTMMLADQGARVVKIERPGTGDDTRAFGPFYDDGSSVYFEFVNRGKESVALDLKKPDDLAVAKRMIAKAVCYGSSPVLPWHLELRIAGRNLAE
jgi:CoA:oxalate CoA-transferase